MRFILERASDYNGNNVNCPEAKVLKETEYEKVWYVEFNTLEELVEFSDKYKDIIIENSHNDDINKEILIYDDYIE